MSTGPPAFDGAQCDERGCTSKAEVQLTYRARRKQACEEHTEELALELVRPEAEERALHYAEREFEKMLDKTLGRSRTINIKF